MRYKLVGFVFLLSVLVSMILLGGCGVKVDTLLQIEDNQSGKREMKCTLNKADVENYMADGVEGLIYIIRQNVPPEIEYNITTNGKDLVLEFDIVFKNLLEYKEKTNHILGVVSDRVMVCRNNEFGQMVQIWEDYTTRDLLGWLIKGLMTYHVIEGEQDINMIEEQTSLRIDGKDINLDKESGSNIIYSSGEDNGASKIDMSTEIINNKFYRRITFLFPNHLSKDKIKQYFNKYPDFICEVINEAEFIRAECEISIKDFDQLQDKTGQMIGGVLITEKVNYNSQGIKTVTIAEQYDFTSVQNIKNCKIFYEESRLGSNETVVKMKETKKINPVIKYQYELNASYNKIIVTTNLTNIDTPSRQIEFYLEEETYQAYETKFNDILTQNLPEKIKVVDFKRGNEHVFVWHYNGHSLQEINEIESFVLGTNCQSIYERNYEKLLVNFSWKDYIDLTKTLPFGSESFKDITYFILIPDETTSLDTGHEEDVSENTYWKVVNKGKYMCITNSAIIDVKGSLKVNNILLYTYLVFLMALILIILLLKLICILLKKSNKRN